MSFLQPKTWSISEVNRYLKELLESDHNLNDLWVQGEISNLSRPASGHLYFTLKDAKAALRGVMWRTAAARLPFQPRDGDAVEVHGSISIYEVSGQYQLYADQMRPVGEGALYQEFLRLKAKLEAEGLFDAERKRPLPAWPGRIGIVTSASGAALRDMLNTLRRRYPLVEVILAASAVQGVEAPAQLVQAIQALNQQVQPDLILVARGGGSIEDLWAFNDERVARAIAASQAPVIAGVGHETDFTIADFVADQRAATPTAAAELATPDRADLLVGLQEASLRLARGTLGEVNALRWQLDKRLNRLQQHSPALWLPRERQRLDELAGRMHTRLVHRLQLQSSRLDGHQRRLQALNPLAILQRGYAVVSRPEGGLIRQVGQVKPGDPLRVRVSDGSFAVQVDSLETSPND